MTMRNMLIVISFVAGMVSEPFAMASIIRIQPPIQWTSLALIGIGSAVAEFMVLGFQELIGNRQFFHLCWELFGLGTVYFFGVGMVAFIFSIAGRNVLPHSLLFLTMTFGLAIGLFVTQYIFTISS